MFFRRLEIFSFFMYIETVDLGIIGELGKAKIFYDAGIHEVLRGIKKFLTMHSRTRMSKSTVSYFAKIGLTFFFILPIVCRNKPTGLF